MSDKTIYDKLNLINQKTNDIKQTLVDYELTTPDEATLENLPIIIGEFLEKSGGINPYEKLYMQKTANETSMKGLFAYTPASTTLDLSMMNTSKVTDMSYMFSECKVPSLDLSGFDVSNVSTMDHMFYYCTSEINIDGWDTSSLTNTSHMFSNFTNGGKYLDLSVLDFSNVTKADNMFEYCDVNYVDIRNLNLNLSKLSTLPFKNVKGTVLDLSNYDITGLTSIYNLCYFCSCPTVDLTNWKTTEVTKMNQTFYYCSSIEKIIMPDWDMTNVTNTSSFFYQCSKLNYIDLSRSNDTTIAMIATLVPAQKLATYGQILIPADSSQANIEALVAKYWKPIGPRIDMTSTELCTELDEIKPGKTTKLYYGNSEPWYGNDVGVEYVSSDESVATIDIDKDTMMVVSTGIEGTTEITARIADTQEAISEPITLSVSETDSYPNIVKFRGTSTPSSTYNYIYVNGTSSNKVLLSKMDYNSVSGIYTYDAGAPITNIQFNGYGNNSSASNTCTDVVKINTSNMTSMEKMFYYCSQLTELDVSSFDTSNVTNMYGMFYGCSKLTLLDLSNFDTSNVTNMYVMFFTCSDLTELDVSSFNTSKVTTMESMFSGCTDLTSIDVSNFDTSNVDNISNMFNDCRSLTSLDLSNFDTSKVTNMNYMFDGCDKLVSIDLSNFNMSKANNTQNMFGYCSKLHTIRLDNCNSTTISRIIKSSQFPTNAIEGVTRKIYCKQANALGLTAPTNWVFEFVADDSEVPLYVPGEFKNNKTIAGIRIMVNNTHTDLSEMFYGCDSLKIVETTDWDTSNVTTMYQMFYNCKNLTSLDLSNFDTSNVTAMDDMFAYCSNLTELDLSNFDTSKVTNMSHMFDFCSNLTSLDLSNWDMTNVKVDSTYSGDNVYMFRSCPKLHTIRLDNCSNDTINKIIISYNFPTGTITGVTRKIYVKQENAAGLTPPENWVFEYID